MLELTLLTVMTGFSLIIVNIFTMFSLSLFIIAFLIIPMGPFIYEYKKHKNSKEIEDRFPDFLRDISQNIRTGMTVPQAIIATKENYYGSLTPHIKKMIVKLDWGIPLDKILSDFSLTTTKQLRRTVSTIIDTHKGGGNIAEIFDSVGKSTEEMNKINKERSSIVYNQMLTGYVIFFVFIGVLIMMQSYLLPSLEIFSSGEMGVSQLENVGGFFNDAFRIIIIIQGFFSGLVIGKLSEGSMISGLKHSIILVIVGVLALLIFI
jgi:flagellar protein FlaJ